MEESFKKLEEHYGSKAEVARKLGITPRHYSRIRASLKPKKTIQNLMRMMIKAIDLNP